MPFAHVSAMEPAALAPAAHRKVLVVDDDVRSRTAVARLLAEEGYDATVAADGEEATDLLATWQPDLVLTDLHMPRLDGAGLLQRVRRLRPGTPVIIVSARGETDATRRGAAAFFPKPLPVDALLARIRELLGA